MIQEVGKQLAVDTTIEVISFSTVMHSLILLDENKKPLTRMMTWTDNRAKDQARK